MKLKRKNNSKTILLVGLIVLAVLVVGAIIFAVVSSIAEEQESKEIINISVDTLPKLTYNIGEEFDPTGARVQVITKDSKNSTYINCPNPEVTFSGFDSSVATESQTITVSYQGFTTTFTVKIKDNTPPPTLVSIEVRDLHTTYTVTRWNKNGPSLANAYLVLTYSDGSTKGSYEETPLLWDYVEPLSDVEGAGTTQMVINYSEGEGENEIVVSTTVTITITE